MPGVRAVQAAPGSIPLADADYERCRRLLYRRVGINLGPHKKPLVSGRLEKRLRARGIGSWSSYIALLESGDDGVELQTAVDLLTTNETYFFREEYQLRAFRDEILPQLKARAEERGTRRLALWSAGCSSGEEAYTLGILVEDSGLFKGWDVRIYGNDISRRVLHKARRAVYTEASFRTTENRYLRYFVEVPEGRQVHPHIRAMCHFGHLNLLDHSRTAIVGRVDAVFCRNVLIYFDPESRRRAIDTFYQRLVAGGYLLLGHSESLLNASTAFELVHVSTDLVYRRPAPHLFRTPSATEGS